MACLTTADCAEVSDGCCMRWTVDSTLEGGWWGGFSSIWGGEENIVPGAYIEFCANAAYTEARYAANEAEGPIGNNYTDLQIFLDTADEATLAAFELFPGDTVEDWIYVWDGDAETQKNFMINVSCVEDLGAASLVAGAT